MGKSQQSELEAAVDFVSTVKKQIEECLLLCSSLPPFDTVHCTKLGKDSCPPLWHLTAIPPQTIQDSLLHRHAERLISQEILYLMTLA